MQSWQLVTQRLIQAQDRRNGITIACLPWKGKTQKQFETGIHMAVSYSTVSPISSQKQAIWNDIETVGAKILTILTVILILTQKIKRPKNWSQPQGRAWGRKKWQGMTAGIRRWILCSFSWELRYLTVPFGPKPTKRAHLQLTWGFIHWKWIGIDPTDRNEFSASFIQSRRQDSKSGVPPGQSCVPNRWLPGSLYSHSAHYSTPIRRRTLDHYKWGFILSPKLWVGQCGGGGYCSW